MDTLIQETLLAFQERNVLNLKDGFNQEKDLFNEILLKNIHNKLDASESTLFRNCRETLNRALDLGRAKNLKEAFEHFKTVEAVLCQPKISHPCQLLIATFYSSGLAYLRIKESKPEEANALSLQSLVINNYLIQEHGYDILEMHRVQQIVNLARIQMAIGQKKAAFKMLFDLIRCFENLLAFPECNQLNPLHYFKEAYASISLAPSPIGQHALSLPMSKVYSVPIKRFKNNLGGNAQKAVENCFLLDFSALSFELVERMFDQIILELVRFTKGFSPVEVADILYQHGFQTIADLNNYKMYQAAYLFLAMKIHAANEDHPAFLKLLKAFCAKATLYPIWKAVGSDFYSFCQSSKEINSEVKNQVSQAVLTG